MLRQKHQSILLQLAQITLAFACLSVAESEAVYRKPESLRPTHEGREWVDQTLKELSLEEKVGQMLQVRYYLDYKSFEDPEYKLLLEELRNYHIGSVVCGMHFDKAGPIRSSALEAARVANQLQADSKLPLLLAADLERGVASRLHDVPAFPWPMAFGAANDADAVERFAAITAKEARAVGIHWALAPVADVNNNPANPIINTRSFGEDPASVGALVSAFIRGAHKNGLLVTAKHFPGNGDIAVDSHRDVAVLESSLEHLERIEFPPFKDAINAGVDSIMLAHARVPAIDADLERITTTSPKVVNGVLRNQLGFKGVVLTDALEMRGLTRLYDPKKGSPTARAAVDAVMAGNDVIMVPTDLGGAFHAIIEAVRSQEIPESQIDESVRKILQMKASVGLHKSRFVDLDQVNSATSDPSDMNSAQRVADDAVTLVRNNGEMLPLQSSDGLATRGSPSTTTPQGKRELLVLVLAEALEASSGHELERAVKARRPGAQIFYFDGRFSSGLEPEIIKAVNDSDKIIIAAYVILRAAQQVNVQGTPMTFFGLTGPSGRLLRQVLALAPNKTVVASLGSPYLIESFPQIQTYVCTYAMASTSEISAVKALFGEIQNHAKLPITLPGIAPRGFSLPWPVRNAENADRRPTP
jgi:beta-N-acetylhexosaminidase